MAVEIPLGFAVKLIEIGYNWRKYLADQRQLKRNSEFASDGDGVREIARIYSFLATLYEPANVLLGPDGYFPTAIMPLSSASKDNIDRLSVNFVEKPFRPPISNNLIAETLRRKGREIKNRRTFALAGFNFTSDGLVDGVDSYLDRYVQMINSADFLEYELLSAFRANSDVTLRDLPARREAISRYSSSYRCIQRGGGVSAALAISTLVVYRRENSYWMLCEVRSKRVGEYGNLYHVAPSFIYQPIVSPTESNIKIERLVTHNIFREYLEELFHVDEVGEEIERPVAADYFYGHPNLVFLRKLLADNSATIAGTGIALNLLNHRAEICSVLIIQDDDWWEHQKDLGEATRRGLTHIHLNPEFFSGEFDTDDDTPHLEEVTTLPIDSERWADIVKPWTTVPPAAPAIVLGAKYAARRLGLVEPAWLKRYSSSKSFDF